MGFAVHSLHRTLLQTEHPAVDTACNTLLFRTVLFPLLLRSQPHSKEDHQLTLKLLALIFQKWLHDISGDGVVDGSYHLFWFKMLETICKFIVSIRADPRCVDAEGLVVQCTESLKNVILVLLSQHHFE